MVSILSEIYVEQGRVDEAERMQTDTLEARKRVQGEDHPDTLASMDGLAHIYMHQGRYEESESLLERTVEMKRRVHGEDHPATLDTVYRQACLEVARDRPEAAIGLLRDAVDRGWAQRRILIDPHMESLRGKPEFERLVTRVEEKLDPS
jgi:tetratricopeptide (TPR) repeat protein